ncbi:PspC domain-containing protein [Fulvivirga sedimenti]|uniref:PspC domain-containing protein n=1 Tax=Fulvivirga sedimenti TaxID=2879465 RepID=A0A9X1HKI7_9BACT|nr:PspC domain-containing protein [Fulvivirga sedimenti]MCA6073680.1 PspC domain-containing protein [Fulvivirga sedimenti]
MKKNISINISGIIFHIEEDAYEQLRDYLQSINRYFSNFDDSDEIIADIESRIAEIFLAKLSEEKQVITAEDVSSLISTMGNVSDFQAMEQDEPVDSSASSSSSSSSSGTYETETRRLYRDEKGKIVGGVCSGLAYYFNIDPVWIRLLMLILVLGYGVGILVYIVLWIVVPGKYDLPEQKSYKKMYRDPENRVLGGVSSGIASYFGVDTIIIRLLFVIFTIAGGTGILAYIVLWIVLPEARTISDKVRMKGDPVTLSNIESSVKKNLNIDEKKEEDTITKILLFPFRLIATVINGIGKVLGPILMFLVDAIRVIIGIFMVFLGVVLTFSFIVSTSVVFGLLQDGRWGSEVLRINDLGIPLDVISNSFPVLTVIAVGIAVIIPSVFVILLGISVIAKKIIFNATTGWTLLALFVISSIFLSINIPAIIYQFKEEGSYEVVNEYRLGDKTAVFKINEVGLDDYDGAGLRIVGSNDSLYRITTTYRSQGSTRKLAEENARMISYGINAEDSVFTFDSNIKFDEEAIFRGQRVFTNVYVPYGARFMMDNSLRYILRNSLYSYNYNRSELNQMVWTMDEEKGLVCLTCPEPEPEPEPTMDEGDSSSEGFSIIQPVSPFRELEVSGPAVVNIMRGDEFKILINEGSDEAWNETKMDQDNVRLRLEVGETNESLAFTITVPDLESIILAGSSRAIVTDLQQNFFRIVMEDNSSLIADIDVQEVEIELEDNATAELHGSGRDLDADIQGFSELNAFEYTVNTATIRARGKSKGEILSNGRVYLDKNMTSQVDVQGNAQIITED